MQAPTTWEWPYPHLVGRNTDRPLCPDTELDNICAEAQDGELDALWTTITIFISLFLLSVCYSATVTLFKVSHTVPVITCAPYCAMLLITGLYGMQCCLPFWMTQSHNVPCSLHDAPYCHHSIAMLPHAVPHCPLLPAMLSHAVVSSHSPSCLILPILSPTLSTLCLHLAAH